jgi:hypothetical protein
MLAPRQHHRFAHARRESGQAVIVVLALCAALGAALLVSFNVGQAVNAKQRVVNAADAAAYSTAVWQARSLNYQAYLNRAVVANEAAIAQSVSLRSWSGYMNGALDNISRVTWFIPKIGQATAALSRVWGRIDTALQPALAAGEVAMSQIDHAFAAAEAAFHAASVAGTVTVASQVAERSPGGVRVSQGGHALLARSSNALRGFTQAYAGSARTRQAELIVRARDGFTAERTFTLAPPGIPALRVEKRGGTDLLGFNEWRGMDTLAAHVYEPIARWREGPVAWGAASNGASMRGRGWHGGSWRTNPRTSRRAEQVVRRAAGYRGVPALRDLRAVNGRGGAARDPELRVAVELARDVGRVNWAQQAMRGAHVRSIRGETLQFGVPRGGTSLRAIGAARVTFDRPVGRADRQHEKGSLFNPYWRAHLAPVERTDRVAAAAANGVVDPFAGARQ